jgi:hypothetical protein
LEQRVFYHQFLSPEIFKPVCFFIHLTHEVFYRVDGKWSMTWDGLEERQMNLQGWSQITFTDFRSSPNHFSVLSHFQTLHLKLFQDSKSLKLITFVIFTRFERIE